MTVAEVAGYDMLAHLSGAVSSARTLEQLARPLLELLEMVSGLESTYLTRIDLEAGLQEVLFARNSRSMQIPEGIQVPWEDTLCKRALEEGRGYTDDVAACWGDSAAARALGIKTYASTPIYLGDGALFGTLCAASSESRPLQLDAREVLTLFSTLIAGHIERERLLERLERANAMLENISFLDALTGLPNRRFLLGELERLQALAQRSAARVLVAFIDLDGFKAINDTYGHDAGDAFLVEVGRRLATGLRPGDVVGRFGGDEFVVVGLIEEERPGPATEDPIAVFRAEELRRRLGDRIGGRYDLPQGKLDYPGASIGVVAADPGGASPEELIRRADALMYEDKRARRELPRD